MKLILSFIAAALFLKTLEEALNQIGNQPVFLWAFKENKRARRFYEKHGFHWDGTERVSEFDGTLEVRYVKG